MLQKTDTSTDDLAEAIQLLSTQMTHGFDGVFREFRDVKGRLNALEAAQRETNLRLDRMEQRLDRVEGKLAALEADVKELYRMIDDLRQDFQLFTADERQRFVRLEAFAKEVAKKIGIPYHPKLA